MPHVERGLQVSVVRVRDDRVPQELVPISDWTQLRLSSRIDHHEFQT